MRKSLAASCLAIVLCCACASAPTFPMRAVAVPEIASERNRVLDDLGQRVLSALARRDERDLLLDDQGLRAVLQPTAASQAAALRGGAPSAFDGRNGQAASLARCRYTGLCVQRARNELAGGPLGLREPGFILDRALVVCTEPGGGRVGAWAEGTFVLTDRGFYAVALQRLETPRRDHADLDLAPCDFQIGVRSPRPVVVSGSESH